MLFKCNSLVLLWESAQVELHGSYSRERVLDLTRYTNESSSLRVFAVLLLTPIPCLAVTLLADTIPLSDPADGLEANKIFYLREYFSFLVFTFIGIHQFRVGVPELSYPMKSTIRDSIVVTSITVGIIYGLNLAIGFPLPFYVLTVSPAWLLMVSISLANQWAKQVRNFPGSLAKVFNMFMISSSDILIASLYPVYFYIFQTLSGRAQLVFALLLPVMKLCSRNLFAKVAGHLHDEKPAVVVFNAELFNALFLSYCVQSAPSMWTTLGLMLADISMIAFSLRDLNIARRGLEDLERNFDHETNWKSSLSSASHPSLRKHTSNTLERMSSFLQQQKFAHSMRANSIEMSPYVRPHESSMGMVASTKKKLPPTSIVVMPNKTFVQPRKQRFSKIQAGDRLPRVTATQQYAAKVQRLLYMAEYLILLNYVEVIIPIVFSMYLFAAFQLPNRKYYTVFDDMDQSQLLHTLRSVMFYCLLQFLSLLLLVVMLQRMLGVSPIRQLAFVLEKQFSWVQNNIVFWLLYIVQASLPHSGYDYSFQFEWLKHQSASASSGSESN